MYFQLELNIKIVIVITLLSLKKANPCIFYIIFMYVVFKIQTQSWQLQLFMIRMQQSICVALDLIWNFVTFRADTKGICRILPGFKYFCHLQRNVKWKCLSKRENGDINIFQIAAAKLSSRVCVCDSEIFVCASLLVCICVCDILLPDMDVMLSYFFQHFARKCMQTDKAE